MGKKVTKSGDSATGKVDCEVCGARYVAAIKPLGGGKYSHSSWQCPHGCKKIGKHVFYNGFLHRHVNETGDVLSYEEVLKALGEEKEIGKNKNR